MFDGVGKVLCGMLLLAPLGLWKLVEIIIWLIKHVRIE